MNRFQPGLVHVVIAIVTITAVFGTVGYFTFRNSYVRVPKTNTVLNSPTPTAAAKETPTAANLPFSLSYPPKYLKSSTSDILDNSNFILSIESLKDFPDTVLSTRNLFQVLLLSDSKTSEECYKMSYSNTPLTLKKTINGDVFYYSEPFGGAAAGTHDTNEEYKVFHDNTCYQINLIHFESSDWNNSEDVNLAQKDKEESFNELHQILSTIKFTAEVNSKILEINYSGGLCPENKICSSNVTIFKNGTLSRSWSQEIIQIEKSKINNLVSLINSADFQEIRSKKFTGICPIAYDGQEKTYIFYTKDGNEEVSSCKTDIDYKSPLFSKIEEVVKQ